jgi:hypothetical protein
MRLITNRHPIYHLAFFIVAAAEFTITIVVFVAGVNYVLSQSAAGDIVAGILGIAFIVDIDNKGI